MAMSPSSSHGGSPFSVLGPFNLAYSDLDPVSFVDLGALADGTIVWRVAIIRRVLFSAANERVSITLGTSGGANEMVLAKVDVISPGSEGGAALAAATAAGDGMDYFALFNANAELPSSWVGIAQHSAHLLARDQVGGNIQGSVTVYALISSP